MEKLLTQPSGLRACKHLPLHPDHHIASARLANALGIQTQFEFQNSFRKQACALVARLSALGMTMLFAIRGTCQ